MVYDGTGGSSLINLMPSSERQRLRADLRTRRLQLDPRQRKEAARLAAGQFKRLRWWNNAKRVALYYPIGGELDPRPLRRLAGADAKLFYLPRLWPIRGKRLGFIRWQADTRWHRNRYGILEPVGGWGQLLSARQVDLVVTPLLGFDGNCNRLGTGGGYYDRSFAFRNRHSRITRPRLVGLAYDCQLTGALERQPWDVPLDAVVTPTTIHKR